MNNLKELTDKIYEEGVLKAKGDADQIVNQAKTEAAQILKDAQKEADKIKLSATNAAEELNKRTVSELEMTATKVVDALKQEITNLISGAVVDNDIKAAQADITFTQKAIESAITNWAANMDKPYDIKVIIPEKDQKTLTKYITSRAKEVINNGVTVEAVNNIHAGFQIAPADGSFKVSFSDEDMANFFAAFLRPQIVSMLFKK